MSATGGLPRERASTWYVLGLAGVFLVLGAILIGWPRLGAAIYGVPPTDVFGLAYVPALGLRDLAFGLFLLILVRASDARTLARILAATLVIPAGDMLIVAAIRGVTSPYILLHASSAAALLVGAVWLLRQARPSTGDTP